MIRNLFTSIFLFCFCGFLEATHIVGGVLNYAHNGGNIYTVTLRLFRDCGTGAAGFPGAVVITVKGNNGANFIPSKNLTMQLGTVTNISANLAPCAVAPNPMPCVQEGVYTKTISLPPNVGGYHLYYQLQARNLSLTNINGACNCIGESFYAFVPDNNNNANTNSNAVFNAFPPLFICANQPFTFNHAATDADGDSLAYSLYTPYNGDNGTGPLDPTFSNNVASFTPVNYLSGYTALNPLGPTPFFLNPVTGILTGTPGTIGQFVVGVRVREYRNGVYISETLRDFQFNVLNCPAPPPSLAVPDGTINNGCTKVITAGGISTVSAVWSSIAPGLPGAYNNYLSCTSGCLSNTVTAVGVPPPFVDFRVCGTSTNCLGNNICDTFRVYFNPPLSVTIAPSNPALCNGQSSTTITAVGSGGTPPYSYLWNNVNPSQSISVGVGTYNIRLTDASGCPPVYNSIVVTSYSVPVAVNAGPDRFRCNTSPLASITATFTGGSGVLWSGGTGTFSPNNTNTSVFYSPSPAELSAGAATLFVTTTGNGSCPADVDTVVFFYTNFTGTVATTGTAVSCFGGTNGLASVSVTGGMAPRTFTWNTLPAQSGTLASNLAPGVYSVTVGDNIGCSLQRTVAITQPAPVALTTSVTHVSCFGGANGSASVSASGGSSPYTYSWMPVAQSTSVVSGLQAGNYSVSVSDSKFCTTSGTLVVTSPASLAVSFTQTNVLCFGVSSGAAAASVTGGVPPYSYLWNPSGASAASVSSLSAGVYSLTVNDVRSCSVVSTVLITQPTSLTAVASASNETCNYLNNGSVQVVMGGGTPAYSYTWSPGSYSTAAVSGLPSGIYTLSAGDLNGCLITRTVAVNEPAPLSINFVNPLDVSCFAGSNGSVTANVTGGTPAYAYSWSSGSVSTPSITNLPAGTYTLFVTDNNSCIVNASVQISQPPVLSLSSSVGSVSCFGAATGSAGLLPAGGTVPYTYLWLPSGQTAATITALSAGSYTSVVTDAKGCSITSTHVVTQAASLTVSFTSTQVSCFGGNNGVLVASVAGGSPVYTYTWSNPGNTATLTGLTAGNYTLSSSDIYGCLITATAAVLQAPLLSAGVTFTNESCDYLNNGSASATASGGTPGYSFMWQPGNISNALAGGLAAGNYTVTVTDLNGCTGTNTVDITEPATLTVLTVAVNDVDCFGGSDGSVNVQASGGTPNYSYTWTPGNVNSSMISNIPQGIYTVSVSDNNACQAQTTVQVNEPPALSVSAVTGSVACNGGTSGSIALTPAGGTGPYTYFWLPGGQTTFSIGGISAGTYTAVVTDNKACVLTSTYVVAESPSLSVAFTSTNVSCFQGSDGVLNTMVSGGNAPYTYLWSNGANTANNGALQAGVYTVTVTDVFMCTAQGSDTITEPAYLDVNVSVSDESCDYSNNGSATVQASGGTPGYSFQWLPGASSSSVISGLTSGSYTVSATDLNGCITSSVFSITEPAPLAVSFNGIVDVSCNGGSDGSATASGNGGTPNYSYTWSPGGSNSSMLSNMIAGTYTVDISDNNGCMAQNTVTISEPVAIVLLPTISDVQCGGGTNGAISISINGGIAPYSHTLMPGNIIGVNFSNLSPGTYSIITNDANACMITTTLDITQPVAMSTAISFTNADCLTQNGVASISVTSGGVPPFTYSWMPTGGTGSVSTPLAAGAYSVQVTDSTGCSSTKVVNISNVVAPVVSILSTTNVSCFGGSDGALTATHTPVGGPFTYSWIPSGGIGLNASGLTSGIYILQVTDAFGCVGLASSSLVAQPPALSALVTAVNVNCFGESTGSASVSVTGGTPAYSYTWQAGLAAGNNVTGLAAGVYSLSVSDQNNCAISSTFAVSQPVAPMSVIVTATAVSCNSGSNGAAEALTSGGTAPYGYVWTPGNLSGSTISNLVADSYSVIITDIKGCTINSNVAVTEPSVLLVSVTGDNSNCGLANGQLTVSAAGGTGVYSYQWTPAGGSASVATGVPAGQYSASVTDANNCSAVSAFTLGDNPSPLVTVSTVSNVSCFGGGNGAVAANVVGGTGPFTYTWSPSGGNGATAVGLTSGQYTVVVGSANNCTVAATSSFITQPSPLLMTINTGSVSCFGGATGSATITAYGGTPAYSYTWQAGNVSANTVSGLSAGSYTVILGDANLCNLTDTFNIAQPVASLNLVMSSTSVSCAGGANGSASSAVTGGTSPYQYNWLPGNLSGATVSNLGAGIYSVTVTDINSCSAQDTVEVLDATPIILSSSSLNSNCSLANGQAGVTASGGAGAYTYTWSPSGGNGATAAGLIAGVYTVNVADANNCPAVAQATVSDLPSHAAAVSSVTNVSCFGGSNGAAFVSVTGGTGPFTYLWPASGGTQSTENNLSSGIYSVIVTSGNGCTVQAVSPLITQPAPIVINITHTAVSCFGGNNGMASSAVFGGTGAYTYTWLAGGANTPTVSGLIAGNYSLQVNDANSCFQQAIFTITEPSAALSLAFVTNSVSCFGGNTGSATVTANGGTSPYNYIWSPAGGASPSAGSLTAGPYTVSVTDSKACFTSSAVIINEPAQPLSALITIDAVKCNGNASGSATVTAGGGTPVYSYSWAPAAGSASTISGLAAGNYTVLVTDNNSCETSVTLSVNEPPALSAGITPVHPSCGFANGSFFSQVSGGSAPYSYLWMPGAASVPNAGSLAPGVYTLTVTDAENCVIQVSDTLTDIPGPLVSLTGQQNVLCYGGNTGSATISINQGTAPFVINWLPFGGNSVAGSSLVAGSYTATVTDSLGCAASATVGISEPQPLNLSVDSLKNVSCSGKNDGYLSVVAYGGTPAYSYSWSVAQTGTFITQLQAGAYTVTVKDTNNCAASLVASVTQPPVLSVSVAAIQNALCFSALGGASLTTSGGTAPYSYTWSTTPPQNGSNLQNAPAGNYSVSIADINGCPQTLSLNISQPSQVITSVTQPDTLCAGNPYNLIATATGGAGDYYFSWEPAGAVNAGTLAINPSTPVVYTVVAFDKNGCAGTDGISVIRLFDLKKSDLKLLGYTPICPGQTSILEVQTSGSTGPLSYSWNNNLPATPGLHVVAPSKTTNYVVTVSNSCGRSVIDTITVAINDPPVVQLEADTLKTCVPGAIRFNETAGAINASDPVISWTWDFGDGNISSEQDPVHQYLNPGTYSVSVSVVSDRGCQGKSKAPVFVQVYPQPVAAFTLNSTSLDLPYDLLKATNQSSGAVSYFWNFGNEQTSSLTNPEVLLKGVGDTRIQLIAISQFGCSDTTDIIISTNADVVFPTAFTPNEDGPNGGYYQVGNLSNDVFFPYTSGVVDYHLQIFNRWGELIFESRDVNIGWDGYYRGKLSQLGVYVWKAEVKLINDRVFKQSGNLTLIR